MRGKTGAPIMNANIPYISKTDSLTFRILCRQENHHVKFNTTNLIIFNKFENKPLNYFAENEGVGKLRRCTSITQRRNKLFINKQTKSSTWCRFQNGDGLKISHIISTLYWIVKWAAIVCEQALYNTLGLHNTNK